MCDSLAREKVGSGNSSYRLYWSSLYTGTADSGAGSHGCTTPTDGVSLMNNSNCLFSSVCGMERAAEGWSDWETLSNGISHSFEVRHYMPSYQPWDARYCSLRGAPAIFRSSSLTKVEKLSLSPRTCVLVIAAEDWSRLLRNSRSF